MRKVETLNKGDSYSKKFIASDEIVRAIAEVSGDINPVHLDDEYASRTIFKKRIAHGLFCLNGISMIIGNFFPGKGAILISQTFSYRKPVYIGDEIEITITIQNIIIEKDVLELECICENQNKEIVLSGLSKVKWGGEF